jgi:prepilin-type N-terminal cleavage/methylation domain-containing protein
MDGAEMRNSKSKFQTLMNWFIKRQENVTLNSFQGLKRCRNKFGMTFSKQNSKLRNFKICNLQSAICNSQAGLTLIEVMIAIVILAIGLIGVALMQYVAIGGNAFGREMQIATELGQERLEMIKSTAYANVASGNEPLADPDPSRFGGLTFTRRWWVANNCRNINVALNPNNPCDPNSAVNCADAMNNMRAVAVRVCWVDKNGGNHSVTVNGVKWDETATP